MRPQEIENYDLDLPLKEKKQDEKTIAFSGENTMKMEPDLNYILLFDKLDILPL